MEKPKLKKALKKRKLTLYQVISHLGLTRAAHLYEYQQGKKDIYISTAIRITKAMNELAPNYITTVDDII